MVRKKLAVVVAALGAFQTGVVSALGMGEFSLNSALNQPLDAEIQLLNTRDLDKDQVRISLAKSADFKLSGVDRDFFLTNIKFVVELDGAGNGVVKLSTKEPVVEPFLNFLLETRWPTGRLLREYTVLLDLPVFSESGSESVDSATSQQRPSGSRTPDLVETSASVSAISSARQASEDSELRPGETYRVKSDDTLWKIAAKSRPSKDVSIQQTIVGIQRINPRAFMGGNINRLKAGSVLRLPTADEIEGISGKSAVREVANQNRAWKASDDSAPMTDVQLDATDQEVIPDPGYEEQGRLSIASNGDSDEGEFVDGDGGQSGSEALRNELDITEETLSKVERENGELKSRLDGMVDKIGTLQRLLELKDDQLTAMQSEFSEGQPEAESIAPMAAEPPVEDETETALEPEVKQVAKVVPKINKSEPSFFEKYISNPLYSGGAALLILIIAAWVIVRRRKTDEEEMLVPAEELDDEGDDGVLAGLSLDQELEPGLAVAIQDQQDAELEEDIADQLVAELEESIASERVENGAEADKASTTETSGVASEIGDVLAEVDIYIAYGRFQQAAELLTSAIAQEPSRSDLQVKLLQVHLETRDKPSFQRQYLSLYALADENAIVEVKELLSTVDGVSDWLDDLPGDSVSSSRDDLSLGNDFSEADLDLDEELEIDLEIDEDLDATVLLNPNISTDDGGFVGSDEMDLDLDNDSLSGDSALQSDSLALDEDFGEFSLDEELADEGLDLDLDDLSLNESDELSLNYSAAENDINSLDDLELDANLEGDELDLDLGDLESSDLGDLDLSEFSTDEEPAPGNVELGDFDSNETSSLDELSEDGLAELDKDTPDSVSRDSSVSSELEDFDLGVLESEVSSDSEDFDLGELDLGDLDDFDLGDVSKADELSSPSLESSEAEVFDLDLGSDGDLDLDLDLDDLSDGDIGDLAAEFDDKVSESVSGLESSDVDDALEDDLAFENFDSLLGDLGDEGGASDSIKEGLEIEDLHFESELSDSSLEEENLDVDLAMDLDANNDLDLGKSDDVSDSPAFAAVTAAESLEEPGSDPEDEDDFDFLSDADEVATKLDLARAYIDMGDTDGARDILDEVLQEGSAEQKLEADALIERIE